MKRLNFKLSIIAVMLIPLSVSVFLTTCAAEVTVMARVDDEAITSIDFAYAARENLPRKAVLERLVEERLIYLEARRIKIRVSEKEVNEEYDRIAGLFPDPLAFHRQLEKESLTPHLLRSRIERQLMVKKYIQEEISAKIRTEPVELAEYLKIHRQELLLGETEFRLSQVVFSEDDPLPGDPALLENMMKDVGLVPFRNLSAGVQKVIADLKIGEVSEPVRIEQSFVIFKVTDIKKPAEAESASPLPLKAKKYLYLEKFSAAYSDLITRLKSKTEIKYYLDEK